ncbi:flagellar basal body L-ring protein FlgH [Marinobacterium weihaiense]|uniref:Flagellar L-ring protein n=1 Tax=Marinobacterium weihaiense TaxID=2851016 RepID=A0ABS6MCP0_9GAMM|nr:flagellar basal body L-ring protein FlgH [Marinobacterium weihaiense]MBV0934055.1 flagellar basal body L-ring protein FlgH [Marinobacterium weihaiense]
MRILIMTAALGLAGCVNKAPKPDNPYYAPIQPAQIQQPRPVTGSLYHAGTSMDLYGDGRAHRVGDIITVVLTERTQSSKSSSTETDKSTNIGVNAPTVLGRELDVFGNPLSASMSGDSSFEGEGSSDMSNSLNGNITVTVHQVLPNGNLLVRGEKWLTLNQGDEYIRISGLVRKQDIGPDNMIDSTRLADARITYSGTGATHDANVMGWLARFFISPLWPF